MTMCSKPPLAGGAPIARNPMRTHRSCRLQSPLLSVLLVIAVPRVAGAQAVNHLYDKLQVGVQGSDVILSSDIRVDADAGPAGTDFELADVGLSSGGITWAASAHWRPGRRHEIDLGYRQHRAERGEEC